MEGQKRSILSDGIAMYMCIALHGPHLCHMVQAVDSHMYVLAIIKQQTKTF